MGAARNFKICRIAPRPVWTYKLIVNSTSDRLFLFCNNNTFQCVIYIVATYTVAFVKTIYILWQCHLRFYLAPSRGTKYCNQRVCMFVCLSSGISRKPAFQISQNFLYMLPMTVDRGSVGPPLTAVQYVMYFRFCGWRHVFIKWTE